MCTDMCTDMHAGMCVGMCPDVRADMCVDICVDTCTDTCIPCPFDDVCIDMCTRLGIVGGRVHRHVYKTCFLCNAQRQRTFCVIALGGKLAPANSSVSHSFGTMMNPSSSVIPAYSPSSSVIPAYSPSSSVIPAYNPSSSVIPAYYPSSSVIPAYSNMPAQIYILPTAMCVCACVRVRAYTCIYYMCVWLWACVGGRVWVWGKVCVCIYARMHVCTYACMHVCMYPCMHVCVHVYTDRTGIYPGAGIEI